MIELLWKEDINAFLYAANLLSWLMQTIHDTQEKNNMCLHGFMLLRDKIDVTSVLLFSESGKGEEEILKILQQPPGEYKDKYVANILSNEPLPVQELKIEDYDEDESEESTEEEECRMKDDETDKIP